MSDELIVCCNGPNISKCDSVVMQGLNFHFKVDLGTSPLAMCDHKRTKFL